jgi:CRP-like cAMP-binding protein
MTASPGAIMTAAAAELLASHPLLARLSAAQAERFARAGQLEDWKPGEEIVVEGTPADALFLILSGAAEVKKRGLHLASLGAGDFFGEMSLMEPVPRSATVIATAESRMLRLPYFALQNLLEGDAQAFTMVLVAIVRVLSERLRRANHLISSAGQMNDWLAGSLV